MNRTLPLIIAAMLHIGCGSEAKYGGDEQIVLEVGSLNPVEVGVLTPSKKFIYLRSIEFECSGVILRNDGVLISPDKATGYYWDDDGIREHVFVFSEIGKYKIYISDNLETELENSFSISKDYTNRKSRQIRLGSGSCKKLSEG